MTRNEYKKWRAAMDAVYNSEVYKNYVKAEEAWLKSEERKDYEKAERRADCHDWGIDMFSEGPGGCFETDHFYPKITYMEMMKEIIETYPKKYGFD